MELTVRDGVLLKGTGEGGQTPLAFCPSYLFRLCSLKQLLEIGVFMLFLTLLCMGSIVRWSMPIK